jgi:predicted nucleic acid-binding protein
VKPTCCDTSFLFSLYGRDQHTSRAVAEANRLSAPLALSPLNEYEFLNAVRFAVFRGVLPASDGSAMQTDFEADKASGRLILVICNLAAVVAEAKRLSATHTQTGGHRAFDVLHVAAALHMGADTFLSFDANQRALAAAERLGVNPGSGSI